MSPRRAQEGQNESQEVPGSLSGAILASFLKPFSCVFSGPSFQRMHREKLKESEREAPTLNGRARARSIFGALCGHVFERSRRLLPREPEGKSIETLPAQTARRARAAGELGHKRSYGLAVSILGRLSPLSLSCSSWSWGSCSGCCCCSRCSGFAFRACTLSSFSRFPFHDRHY